MDDVMGTLTHLQREIDRLGGELTLAQDARQQLNKTLRSTRWLAIAALLLGVLGPLAARWLPITFRTVRARELVVQDATGKTRIQLLADKDFASVIVNGNDGNPGIALKVDTTDNLVYVASRSPNPSTGIRLDSSESFSDITLHHQQPGEGKGSLSGWIQLQSTFQDGATVSVHAADGGRVVLEGAGDPGAGSASFGLWPGGIKDQASSWLKIESLSGRPYLELVETGGMRAQLDLFYGPQLTLNGPFSAPHNSARLGVNSSDKGGTLMLTGEGDTSVFATTGAFARVSVTNGMDDAQAWATPLPKPKAPEKK